MAASDVANRIARKLEIELGWHPQSAHRQRAAAIIDAELARERNEELYRARNESHEAKQAWARAIDRAEKAEAELARERDASWVSVKERLPEKGKRVLVYFANVLAGPYFDVWEFSGANQYFAAEPSCSPKEDVTHWQPLPAPPICGS